MDLNDILYMMLIVGIIITLAIAFLFIWGAKTGQFDDTSKMMDGLLYDSTEDLNDAINKENKIKEIKKEKKANQKD